MKSNAIWVLFFLEGSKKQFKSLSVCFENNSIGCNNNIFKVYNRIRKIII